ncbi:hypothetical protein EV360DRAFT_85140 [Lentinula raphanica]|nr:hypothetical protein EV360DRAFT_85140 [Lentinula raphanica]
MGTLGMDILDTHKPTDTGKIHLHLSTMITRQAKLSRPAAPRLAEPNVVTPSSRASRYASPSQSNSAPYTRGSHRDSSPERVPLSRSSRRQSLHPSSAISPSLSPVPAGRYNHFSPSAKDKAKILTESPRSKANINEKEPRVVSKRKSFVRDSSPSAANYSSPSTPSLLPPSPATPSHRRLSPTPSSTIKRESSNTYESVVLAKRSVEALARTRQAFGIPPSDSDAIYRSPAPNYDQNPNQEHDETPTLPHFLRQTVYPQAWMFKRASGNK